MTPARTSSRVCPPRLTAKCPFWPHCVRCLTLAFVLLLGACAPSQPPTPGVTRQSLDADRIWEAYAARHGESGPFRINASLRYGPTNDTRRVTVLIWGNGESKPDAAQADETVLRLDVMAGVGALAARVRETPSRLTAHAPGENKAWQHEGGDRSLLHFGVPVPFSLNEFAALLQGRYTSVFGTNQMGAYPTRAGRYAFELDGTGLSGFLELTPKGLPLRWCQRGGAEIDSGGSAAQPAPCGQGWAMDLAYAEGPQADLPRRITVTHPDGQSAILLVKTRENVAPFSAEQMDLKLPSGVVFQPLSQAPRD